jgi:hypothetical protein
VRGRESPRLFLPLELNTPDERTVTKISHARLQLLDQDELLGDGVLIGEEIGFQKTQVTAEIPVTRRAIDKVTSRLGQDAQVGLKLQWYGELLVTWNPSESALASAIPSGAKPGTPTALQLSNQNEQHLTISRSDWYSNVLATLGQVDYLFLEVAISRGKVDAAWTNTLQRLRDAEKAYALGDDPGVFNHLRGAFDGLPGARRTSTMTYQRRSARK